MLWLPFVIVSAVFGIVIFVVLYQLHKENKRTKDLAEFAKTLELEFLGNASGAISGLEEFSLFQQGRGRQAFNILRGGTEDELLYVFDYRYTTGSGKNSKTHRQTVAYLLSRHLDLPAFELFPERWYHRLGQKLLGLQDIDLEDYPEFSKRYVLRGNEKHIRSRFNERLIRHLESERDVCAAGNGTRFIFFRENRRVSPNSLKEFMQSAYGMYAFMKPDRGEEIDE